MMLLRTLRWLRTLRCMLLHTGRVSETDERTEGEIIRSKTRTWCSECARRIKKPRW